MFSSVTPHVFRYSNNRNHVPHGFWDWSEVSPDDNPCHLIGVVFSKSILDPYWEGLMCSMGAPANWQVCCD